MQVDLSHIELASTRLEPADVQQSLDESGEAICLLVDRFEDFLLLCRHFSIDAFFEQLEIADDDVDRGLQLVRGN